MRFALLGDHADGLDVARALAETGRHELVIYSGSGRGAESLRRWNLEPARAGDIEEVLADPRIEAVIVAGGPADRSAQLRRVLQSERHALCVHPLADSPDSAYEAAMLQGDTHQVLLPLLPEALHPGVRMLAETTRLQDQGVNTAVSAAAVAGNRGEPGCLRLIEMERWSTEHVLLDGDSAGHEPGIPGWDVLRALGGDLLEVTAVAATTELAAGAPLILAGVFENGGLLQALLLPDQHEARLCLTVVTSHGRSKLVFPQGWPGPARLSWLDDEGKQREENWETWNPWPRLVKEFEAAMAAHSARRPQEHVQELRQSPRAGRQAVAPAALPMDNDLLSWQDEVRCLELDDAARRSVERRRTTTLEYQEASEEAGFKGTMTLVGCSLIWLSLLLLIVSVWLPWLFWLIVPVFAVFLLLQLLRWIVPGAAAPPRNHRS